MMQVEGDSVLRPGQGRTLASGANLRARFGVWGAVVLMVSILVIAGLLATTQTLPKTLGLSLLAAAATLCALITAMALRSWWQRRGGTSDQSIEKLLEIQQGVALVTDAAGNVRQANASARRVLQIAPGDVLTDAATISVSDAKVLTRLMQEAGQTLLPDPQDISLGDDAWTMTAQPLTPTSILWTMSPATPEDDADTLAQVTFDANGSVVLTNDHARTLLGHKPGQIRDVFGHDGIPASGSIVSLATASGDRRILVSDLSGPSHERRIALVPLPTAPPKPTTDTSGWAGIEDLPAALLWISPDGIVQRANKSAMRLIGHGCGPGVNLIELTEGLGRPLSDWLDEAMSGVRGNAPEFLRVTGSSKEVFVQMSLHPYNHDGKASLLAVLNDATELKTLEAQFVQSQKMQAIGQLAGGVAHDFNNLLTAISGHCDLLLLRHDQGDPEYADLMQINQNSNRAAALVNQLLAFSRKQTLRPEEIDLRDTLADLTHLLNRLVGEKITLSFSHDAVLGAIRADKRQLEQVLMNLVVNARDAINGTGEIRIVTERVRYDSVQTWDQAQIPPGEYVSVKVIDTGCGIPPDRLNKVFEPFYTTKKVGEGTGLGLSTVYGIIKQTGGFIFADSTLGEGTCFTLLFRATKSDPTLMQAKTQDPSTPPKHADGVVLLVEDEAPVRAFASRALRLRGYTVIEAESGEDALKTLEDKDLHVDIFVTDVVMPGMDGPTWVRQALQTRPNVRVIFVSGYAEEHFGEDQARIPNSVFLPKPFSLAELTQTVQGS